VLGEPREAINRIMAAVQCLPKCRIDQVRQQGGFLPSACVAGGARSRGAAALRPARGAPRPRAAERAREQWRGLAVRAAGRATEVREVGCPAGEQQAVGGVVAGGRHPGQDRLNAVGGLGAPTVRRNITRGAYEARYATPTSQRSSLRATCSAYWATTYCHETPRESEGG
jgi:hypothetical protein